MTRIDISYGGQWYSIGNRSLEEVHEEIRVGVLSGHHWLEVNDGEGNPRPAFLSITPGVPIAVIPIPDADLGGPSVLALDMDEQDEDTEMTGPVWTGPSIHTDRSSR